MDMSAIDPELQKKLEALGLLGQDYQGLPLAPGVTKEQVAQEMAPVAPAAQPQSDIAKAIHAAIPAHQAPAMVNKMQEMSTQAPTESSSSGFDLSKFGAPKTEPTLSAGLNFDKLDLAPFTPSLGTSDEDLLKPTEIDTGEKISRGILAFLEAGSGRPVTDWAAKDKAAYEQKVAPLLLKKKLEESNLANAKTKMELFKLDKEGNLSNAGSSESQRAREALKATYDQAGLKSLSAKITDNLSANDLKNFPGADKVISGMFEADKEKRQLDLLSKKEEMAENKLAKQQAKMSPSDILKVTEGKNMDNILSEVDKQLTKHKDVMGPIQGRLKAANPYDTEAQAFQSAMASSAQLIGKYLEGGVLRAEDVPKYQKMLPQMSDTPDVAKEKLNNVRTMIKNKQETDVGALKEQGKNIAGLESAKPAVSFPKQVKKGGQVATVSNDQELKEAQAEGWQ